MIVNLMSIKHISTKKPSNVCKYPPIHFIRNSTYS